MPIHLRDELDGFEFQRFLKRPRSSQRISTGWCWTKVDVGVKFKGVDMDSNWFQHASQYLNCLNMSDLWSNFQPHTFLEVKLRMRNDPPCTCTHKYHTHTIMLYSTTHTYIFTRSYSVFSWKMSTMQRNYAEQIYKKNDYVNIKHILCTRKTKALTPKRKKETTQCKHAAKVPYQCHHWESCHQQGIQTPAVSGKQHSQTFTPQAYLSAKQARHNLQKDSILRLEYILCICINVYICMMMKH